jgi:phenylalanyl-tRNA synthetase alpha chain
MEQLLAQVAKHKLEILAAVVTTKDDLEVFRVKYLGTKGLVKTIMAEMREAIAKGIFTAWRTQFTKDRASKSVQ